MGWLLLAALVLGGLGLWLLLRATATRQEAGLPEGRVTYVDTGAWDRCERPLFSRRHRLTGRPDYLVRTRTVSYTHLTLPTSAVAGGWGGGGGGG